MVHVNKKKTFTSYWNVTPLWKFKYSYVELTILAQTFEEGDDSHSEVNKAVVNKGSSASVVKITLVVSADRDPVLGQPLFWRFLKKLDKISQIVKKVG